MLRYNTRRKVSLLAVWFLLAGTVAWPGRAQDPPQPPSRPSQSRPPAGGKQKAPPVRQGAQVEPEQQDPAAAGVIKLDTELVVLDVTVVDQLNNPVYSLTKDDFVVFEDKVKQEVEAVSREEVPISFGIVIDTSGSMRSKLQTVTDAAALLIKEMKEGDEGFVAQFKIEPELVQDFTSDQRELEEALGELYTSGGTSLLDAIIATADYAHEKGKQRRKALIVISDGLEKNSSVKEKEVMEAMKEDEVQVYIVGFINEDEPAGLFSKSPAKRAKELLTRIAEDSGGRAFFPKEVNEMPAVAAQISKDLRTQYVLSYYPSNQMRDGRFRTVRVNVNPKDNRKLIARTRQGYYARSERESPERRNP